MQTPLLLLVLSAPVIRASLSSQTEEINYFSNESVTKSDDVQCPLSTLPLVLVKMIFKYYFDPDEFNLHCTIDLTPNSVQQKESTSAEDFISLSATKDETQITFKNSEHSCTFGYDDQPKLISKKIDYKILPMKGDPRHGSLLSTCGDLSLRSKYIQEREYRMKLSRDDHLMKYWTTTSPPRIAAISQRNKNVATICNDNHFRLHTYADEPRNVDLGSCNVKCMAFSVDGSCVHLCGEKGLYNIILKTQKLVKTEIEYPGAIGLAISNDGSTFVVYKENKLLVYRKTSKGRVMPYFPFE